MYCSSVEKGRGFRSCKSIISVFVFIIISVKRRGCEILLPSTLPFAGQLPTPCGRGAGPLPSKSTYSTSVCAPTNSRAAPSMTALLTISLFFLIFNSRLKLRFKFAGAENHKRLHCTTHGTSILKSSATLEISRHPFMISEITSTHPICGKHDRHHSFRQKTLLVPASCRSFLGQIHAHCKFRSLPSLFIIPPSDLFLQSHCRRIPSSTEISQNSYSVFFSQLHCSWVVYFKSKLFTRRSPVCIVIRKAFRLHLLESSFLSAFPWHLPGSAGRPFGALKGR